MRHSLATLALGFLLPLGACAAASQHQPGPATRPAAEERAEIEELSRRFSAAYVRGDAETMAGLYTPDAVIFPGNREALRGTDAIRAYWMLDEGERVTMHRATPTEIRIDGDHAYDHGVFEIAGMRNGEAWGPSYGKYVIVWRRTPQGWRMHLDMWNSRPAP